VPGPRTAARADRARVRATGARSIRATAADQPRGAPTAIESARELAAAGQQALDADQNTAAVTAFRKWAYLAPGDAMAHLHLGLALEITGDQQAARRAFGAARRAVLLAEKRPDDAAGTDGLDPHAIDGYAPQELLRLLEAKDQDATQ
jgi:Flp pilus assembly protein TadD